MKQTKFLLPMILFSLLSVTHAEVTPISATTITTVSQTPSDESLQKLMVVMQYDKTLDQVIMENQQWARQLANQSLENNPLMGKLSPEQKIQFQREKTFILQKMIGEQNTSAIRQQIIMQYKEISKTLYTQAEVNAMIDFFSTPVGQSLRSKQGDFAIMTAQKITPIARENQRIAVQKAMTELQKKLAVISQQPITTVKK